MTEPPDRSRADRAAAQAAATAGEGKRAAADSPKRQGDPVGRGGAGAEAASTASEAQATGDSPKRQRDPLEATVRARKP